MAINLDVIVDVGANAFPLGQFIAFYGQRLQGRPIQFTEQRSARTLPFPKAAVIQPLQQLSNGLIDLRHGIKVMMPKSGHNPALYNLNADLRLGFGEKRALQIVGVMAQEFSPSHILSIL